MKNIQNIGLLLSAVFLLQACGTTENKPVNKAVAKITLPNTLEKGLKAHGGLDLWKQMKSLTYSFDRGEVTEIQKTSLVDRKALIVRDSVQVGYDGNEVWVAPNKAAFGKSSARFYHNLIFYFYAMPFVLADPGIIYEEVPAYEIDGISYPGIKISYNDGVGDAPDDYYIAYFHPETNEMYLLLYTVTYFQGGPSQKFNALVYEEWQNVNGLKLPLKMVGYKFDNDMLGEKRYERIFNDAKLSKEPFKASMFEMPAVAEIDSLLQK